MKWTQKGRAVLQRTRAAVARIKATIHAAGDQNTPQGHQGRLAPMRAELLPPLSPGRAPCGSGRYVDEPSRIQVRRSKSERAMAESYGATSNTTYDWLMSDGAGRDRGGAGSRRPIPRDVQGLSAAPARVLKPCPATDVRRPSAIAMVHGTGDWAVADCGRRDCRQRLE